VLLSTPLHASSNFTVSVQLANKRGLKKHTYPVPEETKIKETKPIINTPHNNQHKTIHVIETLKHGFTTPTKQQHQMSVTFAYTENI
jgi:hypothetical protein